MIQLSTTQILRSIAINALSVLGIAACAEPGVHVLEEPRGIIRADEIEINVDARVIRANPDTLVLTATIRNVGPDTVYLQSSCQTFSIQAYRTSEPLDRPLWDSRLQRYPSGARPACFGPQIMTELEPGGSTAGDFVVFQMTADTLLGDSLPPDDYELAAILNVRSAPSRFHPDPTRRLVYLPAGRIRVRR